MICVLSDYHFSFALQQHVTKLCVFVSLFSIVGLSLLNVLPVYNLFYLLR